ncbi:reverse transcriptase domain-containing protein [Tanacetum coccineum]
MNYEVAPQSNVPLRCMILGVLHEESPSPLVRWIEEFQLPDGLRVPSHVGYYDGKGDPNDFIHAFERATKMEKWVMPVSWHMFIYILKDATRVWWNSLPKRVVLDYEDLKIRFRIHFNQQKKQTKSHLAVNGIKRREGESVRDFITRYTDETAQISKLNEDQRIIGFVHRVKIKSLVKFISTELPESYDVLMEKVYSWLQAEESASKGRPVVEEAVRLGKLAHLIKGIEEGKARQTDTQLADWIALMTKVEPAMEAKEEPILMI